MFTDESDYLMNVKVTKALKILGINQVTKTVRHLLYEKGIDLVSKNTSIEVEDIVSQLKEYKSLVETRANSIKDLYSTHLAKQNIKKLKLEFNNLVGLSGIKSYLPAFELIRVSSDHIKFVRDNETGVDLIFNATTIDLKNSISNLYKKDLKLEKFEEVIEIVLDML